ncbi:survivin [Saccharomycopsis crataegensis]|uniref:Survivin n=1 Tax=Saccharomycopsis crataegensis TaxID=43959 RepID=A0AAV5QPA3_9ASCO|nr:survivin [Saccharomycopsis crataegensis]
MPPNNMFEQDRLETFSEATVGKKIIEKISWPYEKPSAKELARFGFYFAPTKTKKDQVVCTCCHKRDWNWKKADNIAEFHLFMSPKCGFALFHKAWSDRDAFTGSAMDLSYVKKNNINTTTTKSHGYDWSSVPFFSKPTSKECHKIRKQFFQSWTKESPSASEMINAGFYNFPMPESPDTAICLYCKISLEDWQAGDDPAAEHRRLSPNCYFFESSGKSNAVTSPTVSSVIGKTSTINTTTVTRSSKKRSSPVQELNDGRSFDSGALIASKSANLNKKIKRVASNNSHISQKSKSLRKLLDDTSSESLKFLANFADANKENRRSEDFEDLVSFDKSIRRFKGLQKYNSSLNSDKEKSSNSLKSLSSKKSSKKPKTKVRLLFKSDEEAESVKKETRTKSKGVEKKKNSKKDIDLNKDSDHDGTLDKKSELQSLGVLSESSRNYLTEKQNAAQKHVSERYEEPLKPNTMRDPENDPLSHHGNEESDHQPMNIEDQDNLDEGYADYADYSDDQVVQPSFEEPNVKVIDVSSDFENENMEIKKLADLKQPLENVTDQADDSDSDPDDIIDDSALISPDKKDPSLYSSSTPIAISKTNFDAFKPLDLDKPLNSSNLRFNELSGNIVTNPVQEPISIHKPQDVSFIENHKTQSKERSKLDYREYSFNPVNYDDSDFDVSVSVCERGDDEVNLENGETPSKSQPPAVFTPLFNPTAEGTEIEISNYSTPTTPSQKEIQLRDVDCIPFWVPKKRSDISNKYEDLEKANDFLKTIANLDYQLSEDVEGILTAFISQVPENELNMTIAEWVKYQTEQCKKLLRLKCEAMINEFEEGCMQAIDFAMKM